MLTDTQVRNAKPGNLPRKLFDARGLYLQVMPHGGKWWRLNYESTARTRLCLWESIPTYPLPKPARAIRRRESNSPTG